MLNSRVTIPLVWGNPFKDFDSSLFLAFWKMLLLEYQKEKRENFTKLHSKLY